MKITVMVLEPRQGPEKREILNDLDTLQAIVGGDLEAVISSRLRAGKILAYCNEVGAGLLPNFVSEGLSYRGTVVFTGFDSSGATISLEHNQILLIETWLGLVVRS